MILYIDKIFGNVVVYHEPTNRPGALRVSNKRRAAHSGKAQEKNNYVGNRGGCRLALSQSVRICVSTPTVFFANLSLRYRLRLLSMFCQNHVLVSFHSSFYSYIITALMPIVKSFFIFFVGKWKLYFT